MGNVDPWQRMVAELEIRAARVGRRTGYPPGADHPKATLTERQVILVLQLAAQGLGPTEIGRRLGCAKSQCSKIINGHARRRERLAWIFGAGGAGGGDRDR